MRLTSAIAAMLSVFALSTPASAATFIYDFSTEEPFVGGTVAFSVSSDQIPLGEIIDVRLSEGSVTQLARVRFTDQCFAFSTGLGGSIACDLIEVFVNTSFGSSYFNRRFEDGVFGRVGLFTSTSSVPAILRVTPANAAVPEPSTWLMLLVGFAAVGASLRRSNVSERVTYSGQVLPI